MSAKHFINDPIRAVVEALRSLTLTNPAVVFDEPNKIIYRHPASIENASNKVSLICGGGSGHEPAFVGYVGEGFLTACVAGTIFASPAAEQVRTCVAKRLPKDTKGILVIVMNYTGDVLNFGMGAEKARSMGKDVEMIVIGDDVGVGREKGGKVGRRGIAGAVLAVKLCGALAEMGESLGNVANVGRLAGENMVSVAVSLSRVHVIGKPASDATEEDERLPIGRVELGMGIHNEPGCEQLETDVPGTVKKMLAQLLDQNDKDRAYVKIDKSDQVVLLMNNFGGISNLELGAIISEVWKQLGTDYGIKPVRVFTGVFNGSLNGLGFGISILRLADTGLGKGKSMLDLIDAPTEVAGWPAPIKPETWSKEFPPIEDTSSEEQEESKPGNLEVDANQYTSTLQTALNAIIKAEPEITKYDSIVGDGDCGVGLKRGAEAILNLLSTSKPTSDLLTNLRSLTHVVETNMDGTSGALYAIFLNSLLSSLTSLSPSSPTPIISAIWAKALRSSLQNLGNYTPARPGDRTLVDALEPFVDSLEEKGDAMEASKKAWEGAEGTKGMVPKLGRTTYVGGEGWKNVPDPGAWGVAVFLGGLVGGE